MVDKTKEIATAFIEQARVEEPSLSTGAWSLADEMAADLQQETPAELVTIDHPIQRSRLHSIGQAVYWLTHRKYRHEVRERAKFIAEDMANGLPEKTLLPPRSRDFHVTKRRRLSADFALDIQRQLRLMRLTSRMIGTFALALSDGLPVISPLPIEPVESLAPSIMPPEVEVVETQMLPLDGYEAGDSDFVPKLVKKPSEELS